VKTTRVAWEKRHLDAIDGGGLVGGYGLVARGGSLGSLALRSRLAATERVSLDLILLGLEHQLAKLLLRDVDILVTGSSRSRASSGGLLLLATAKATKGVAASEESAKGIGRGSRGGGGGGGSSSSSSSSSLWCGEKKDLATLGCRHAELGLVGGCSGTDAQRRELKRTGDAEILQTGVRDRICEWMAKLYLSSFQSGRVDL
jgi:hypothetical protein